MDERQSKRTTENPFGGAGGNAWVALQALIDGLFQPLETLLVEGLSPGTSVLDIGCGTGSTTVAAARRVGANGRSTGIDISPPMIDAARDRDAKEGTAASFIVADAQDHSFEPASFDAFISRFGVMFFNDPVEAFTNLRRAAKPDAKTQLIVWRGPEENPFMTAAARAAASLLPDLPPFKPNEPGQFGFADRDRVRGFLEASGWSAIDIQPIDVPCSMPERDLLPYLSQLGHVGRALQHADDELRARVLATVRPAFDAYVHGAEVRLTAACWMIRASATSRAR